MCHCLNLYPIFRPSVLTMVKILVVGGGLTSAITTSLLAKSSKCANIELCVWDKARGCGGRMSTSRLTSKSTSNCLADLGAQYITATPEYARSHSNFYDDLKSNRLLVPLNLPIEGKNSNSVGTIDYICPHGSSSLVKHFFHKASVQVKFGNTVSKLEHDTKQWTVFTNSGQSECFDAVILTMPVPQILELLSNSPDISSGKNNPDVGMLTSRLKSVRYSSRYALGLMYAYDNENELLKNTVKLENGACAKYIYGDSVFRYVSLDSYKRSNVLNSANGDVAPMSVVFHTSVPFGIEHLETNPDEVQLLLLNRVKELFPCWPKPTAVKCQKWRYSQVHTAYAGEPGCLELVKTPLLLAGGDAFTHSNFDGCIMGEITVHFTCRV